MKKYLLLSDYLNVDPQILQQCNILNTFVNDDSGYYICLEEIKNSKLPEFSNYNKQYCDSIHMIYNESPSFLKENLFSEPKFICLGETIIGHKGKGMQLSAIKAIKSEIINDFPYYLDISKFIEIAHVSKKIGRDSLNDYLSNLYVENLLLFTENKCNELNIENLNTYIYKGKSYQIKTYIEDGNPFPVVFYPLNIMRKYVYALTFNDLYSVGYNHKETIHSYEKNASKFTKEEFIKRTPHSLLSKKIKNNDINYLEISKSKSLKGNSKYNNLDIYNEIRTDLSKLNIPNLKDTVSDVSDYVYLIFRQIISKIIEIDLGIVQTEKIIVSDNYKQTAAFICAKINELLSSHGFQTKIVITRGNFFVIKNSEFNQICLRTAYNKSCINEVSTYKKLKNIKNSKRVDYKIVICDPHNNFIKFVNEVPTNKKNHYLVLQYKKRL